MSCLILFRLTSFLYLVVILQRRKVAIGQLPKPPYPVGYCGEAGPIKKVNGLADVLQWLSICLGMHGALISVPITAKNEYRKPCCPLPNLLFCQLKIILKCVRLFRASLSLCASESFQNVPSPRGLWEGDQGEKASPKLFSSQTVRLTQWCTEVPGNSTLTQI